MHNQFWEQLPPVDEFDRLMKEEVRLLEARMRGTGVSKELRTVRRAIRRMLPTPDERARLHEHDVESGYDAE